MNQRWTPAVVGLLAAGACTASPDRAPDDALVDVEIVPIDAAAVARWSTAEPIAELATSTPERYPSLTAGGLVIYFTRTEMVGTFTVNIPYAASRASLELPFGPPVRPVAWGASSIVDQDHADSHTEWFFWRGLGQLGFSARPTAADSWSFPIDLGVDGFSPAISGDDRALYFVDFSGELAVMTRPDRFSAWSSPAIVPVAGDLELVQIDVSDDQLTLLIATDPAGDDAGLYLATRGSKVEGFAEPVLIPALDGPYQSPRFRSDGAEIVCEIELGGDRNLYRSLLLAD